MLRNGVRWEDLQPEQNYQQLNDQDESKSPNAKETEQNMNSKKDNTILESGLNVGVKDTKMESRKN